MGWRNFTPNQFGGKLPFIFVYIFLFWNNQYTIIFFSTKITVLRYISYLIEIKSGFHLSNIILVYFRTSLIQENHFSIGWNKSSNLNGGHFFIVGVIIVFHHTRPIIESYALILFDFGLHLPLNYKRHWTELSNV